MLKSQMEEYRTLIDDYDKVSEIKYELQRRMNLSNQSMSIRTKLEALRKASRVIKKQV